MMEITDNPEGFKMTEIGPLPEEWKIMSLGNLVEILDKLRIPVKEEDRKKQQKIYPYCGANGIIDFVESFIFEGEYLLLAEDGGHWDKFEQSSYIMSGKFWVNNHAHVLRAKDNLTTNIFLMYMLNCQDLSIYVGGDARGKVNQGILKSIRVPLPPLPEQKQIAFVLSTIQKAIEKTEAVINATKELKKSMMKHLFTYGPVSVEEAENVVLKETDIGLMPEEWDVVRLGDVVTLQRGNDLPKRNRKKGSFPVVGSNGIVDYHSKCVASGPGVLVGRSGSAGRVTWIEGSYWPLNTALWVKDFHGNDRRFCYYLLDYSGLEKYAEGVSVPTLNRNSVHPVQISIPSLSVQQEISGSLFAIDQKIETEQIRKKALEELFRTLLHSLMTGKIRVTHLEVPYD